MFQLTLARFRKDAHMGWQPPTPRAEINSTPTRPYDYMFNTQNQKERDLFPPHPNLLPQGRRDFTLSQRERR